MSLRRRWRGGLRFRSGAHRRGVFLPDGELRVRQRGREYKSEAHDSGLCVAEAETRKRFANDLDNLTLATPALNRQKSAGDAAEWLPDHNRCWFAGRVLAVKLEYVLIVDQAEADALDTVLQGCAIEQVLRPQPVEMVPKG